MNTPRLRRAFRRLIAGKVGIVVELSDGREITLRKSGGDKYADVDEWTNPNAPMFGSWFTVRGAGVPGKDRDKEARRIASVAVESELHDDSGEGRGAFS